MKKSKAPICICSKDIHRITGRSLRSSRALLHKIRKINNKTPAQFITIEEFAKYSGISPQTIYEFFE